MSDTKIEFICGNCFHWVEADAAGPVTIGAPSRGMCYGAPPALAFQMDRTRIAGQANARPMLPATERACGAFVPRDALAGGANDDKVN